MSEAATTEAPVTKPVKEKTPSTVVEMSDGRKVEFVGKRKMLKTAEVEGTNAVLRIDFLNGETRKVSVDQTDPLYARYAAHGLSQKIGDEAAGEETVDDMVVSIDAIIERLAKGEWGTERKAGDGFSGASVVIKAIMEATGKDLAFVKNFLETKLAAGKEAGLTRQKLYASFKVPGTKTAPIIERLEREKLTKDVAVNADDALAEMMG
jgi:hypothetical protein